MELVVTVMLTQVKLVMMETPATMTAAQEIVLSHAETHSAALARMLVTVHKIVAMATSAVMELSLALKHAMTAILLIGTDVARLARSKLPMFVVMELLEAANNAMTAMPIAMMDAAIPASMRAIADADMAAYVAPTQGGAAI